MSHAYLARALVAVSLGVPLGFGLWAPGAFVAPGTLGAGDAHEAPQSAQSGEQAQSAQSGMLPRSGAVTATDPSGASVTATTGDDSTPDPALELTSDEESGQPAATEPNPKDPEGTAESAEPPESAGRPPIAVPTPAPATTPTPAPAPAPSRAPLLKRQAASPFVTLPAVPPGQDRYRKSPYDIWNPEFIWLDPTPDETKRPEEFKSFVPIEKRKIWRNANGQYEVYLHFDAINARAALPWDISKRSGVITSVSSGTRTNATYVDCYTYFDYKTPTNSLPALWQAYCEAKFVVREEGEHFIYIDVGPTGTNVWAWISVFLAREDPKLTITKTLTTELPKSGVVREGAELQWEYTVANVGRVTATDIHVTDANQRIAIDCNGQTTLALGKTMKCRGRWTVPRGSPPL